MDHKSNVNMNSITVCIKGELDHSSAGRIKDELNYAISNAYANDIIIDMSELTFMDSSGIGILLGLYKKLKSRNANLYFRSVSPSIERILDISGLFSVAEKL
ncbi:MAG: STAS domain-containing protein [Clostridiales bacterium]|nr:STAS domain-containing protein [Clostridiales bacterium]